ncbi:MAG: LamG domain-containing protein, partial [Planctomycetes bacterium]|nr:LamG domain-containing protein [Planctomycetota bacterium]
MRTPRQLALPHAFTIALSCCLIMAFAARGRSDSALVDRYNVVWNTPSENASGSMPLGNGDIGVNAWVEPTGDIVFYISKTDAWDDNGRLLKVGRVRVRCQPALVRPDAPFLQTLSLHDGTMVVRAGEEPSLVTVRLWVDAHHPVVHLDVKSNQPSTATAAIELWRTERFELPSIEVSDVHLDRSRPNGMHAPTIVEPDNVLQLQDRRIGWYHHNGKSVGPALTARIQGVADFQRADPLLHRTFGAVITARNGKRIDDRQLESPATTEHEFGIFVLTEHPSTPGRWLASVDGIIADVQSRSSDARRQAHERWWADFWARSWIHVTSDSAAPASPMIPGNQLEVKVGVDQHGGSRFRGTIGRVSLFSRALTAAEVGALAKEQVRTAIDKSPALIGSWTEFSNPGLELEHAIFTRPLTIEAWIQTDADAGTSGRIVDKITPGGSDGFLVDTWPGNSLRLIVGDQTLTVKDCLQTGVWHHVAAVFEAGHEQNRVQLWLDGVVIASHAVAGGDDAATVSRAYALQRFINACNGRGRYPIKFNGAIFTVPSPGQPGDADYRRWGPGYWWQNTRLPYLSMCTSGDFEMTQPLYRMYADELMSLQRFRTKRYFDHEGAFIPECIYFWGDVFSETYGWTPFEERGQDKLQTSGWHKWEWVSGPELVWMMLDYYEHTLDERFLGESLLPTAHEILTFFDQHYQVDDQGKLVMHPAQALETWWDCTNPMPELAGLHAVTSRLLALPATLTTAEQRTFWSRLAEKLPPLPTREVDGVRMLAPATRFADKRNIENPELYAVFPFRLIAVGRPDIELGIEALRHRWDRGHFGWRQDDIFMAYLGLADEARANLVARARQHDVGSRFPAFWGPNYDWVPDQDHGGVLMKALQAMVMQTDGDKVFLLPAWPGDWDVSFKLHAPRKTVVEGTCR